MQDAVSEGSEFNTVLVWSHSRLSRKAAEFSGLWRTLLEHGIDLVSSGEIFACLPSQ